MRQAAAGTGPHLAPQSSHVYESVESSPTSRKPPGQLPCTSPPSRDDDVASAPETWLELFEQAGLEEAQAQQLSVLFEQQEMPRPKSRALLQFGVDNELLVSMGIRQAGPRVKIISYCRSLATHISSHHPQRQDTEDLALPVQAAFGTQVYRPAHALARPAPTTADPFSDIPAAEEERVERKRRHSKKEGVSTSSSSDDEHRGLIQGGGSSFRVKAPEDLPVEICEVCDMLSETAVHINKFTGRGYRKFTWIDVCGRDEQRIEYAEALRKLAQRYRFASSLIVDIDLTLALPQLITAPNEPNQFLIIVRIAAESTSIEEDSLHMLTNRLMIAVNLETHTVITLHRKDTRAIAQLRAAWNKSQLPQSVFLCKLLDECLITYVDALHDSESLLDEYESLMLKLTVGKAAAATSQSDQMFGGMANLHNKEYQQQMTHSNSFSRQRMNQLLYHLHRRCSVYNRMLTLMQSTLESAYAALNITSEEYAEQMSRSCGELGLKAETLHDNCQNLLNLHLALVAFRTNELMNILTTFSAVFIPITFVCSVYGMNFTNMPELLWHNGYYYCLAFQAAIVFAVLSWFRVKGLI